MNPQPTADPTDQQSLPPTAGPIFTLLLLSPVVSELLSGSTRLTTIFVLIPATGVWGCAALLIRELARRRSASLWLLGLALAVAEECIIQQTSLAPLIGHDAATTYARAAGVNWEYFVWALGFESVWAVVVPVVLAELIHPARRSEPWLGARGIAVAMVVLIAASVAAWYSWTHVFVPKFYPKSAYVPPPAHLLIAAVVVAVLVALAHRRRHESTGRISSRLPSPRTAGVVAFAWALPWFLQVMVAFGAAPKLPPALAVAAGAFLAVGAVVIGGRWARHPELSDRHRLALIAGIVAATLLGGIWTLSAAHAHLIDRVAQVVFGAAALWWLARMGRQLRRSAAPA